LLNGASCPERRRRPRREVKDFNRFGGSAAVSSCREFGRGRGKRAAAEAAAGALDEDIGCTHCAQVRDQPADAVVAAAERADWEPPTALTAVLLPESQVRPVLTHVDPRTLNPVEDLPGAPDGVAVLLVAEPRSPSTASRTRLLRVVADHGAVVGPTVPWLEVAASYERAVRCHALPGVAGEPAVPGDTIDTESRLAELILAADPAALADLRAKVLAPLASLRPAAVEKLTETLRSWLLHHGRREDIAAELFVHGQTVRYRMSQLREVYGDRLEDPRFVLEATLALAVR